MIHATGSLTAKQCEDLIENLVTDQWLLRKYNPNVGLIYFSNAGKIMVGPRTTFELEAFLHEEEMFFDCEICKTLVTTKVGLSGFLWLIIACRMWS